MLDPPRQAVLRGWRVLLVHENLFQGQYLADVLEDCGAAVVGPLASAADALVRLRGDPGWSALVLSSGIEDGRAVAGAATAIGAALLFVRPARGDSPPPTSVGHVLTAPFAGFQVVEALAALPGARRVAAEPHRGGA